MRRRCPPSFGNRKKLLILGKPWAWHLSMRWIRKHLRLNCLQRMVQCGQLYRFRRGWWKITGKGTRRSHGGIRKMGLLSPLPLKTITSVLRLPRRQTVTTPLHGRKYLRTAIISHLVRESGYRQMIRSGRIIWRGR